MFRAWHAACLPHSKSLPLYLTTKRKAENPTLIWSAHFLSGGNSLFHAVRVIRENAQRGFDSGKFFDSEGNKDGVHDVNTKPPLLKLQALFKVFFQRMYEVNSYRPLSMR